ncbi:CHASE domain-containing protein [Thalassomonas actiniarum]|uniref:Sensor protein FixL n=1 Tax=Thalassomonas actiniarum TaxID=485447 RepID=A0AAE9YS98_9GAMM|nr:CHASE domain-containing protein [Thalassomonas actiniarum]WDD99777.1 CHASE domain-containing protein [Thalassomonas actiniarum]
MIITDSFLLKPSVITSFVLGLLLSHLGYQFTLKQENKEISHELNTIKLLYQTAFVRELELNIEILKDVRKFYQSSNQVTREEFQQFTVETIEKIPAIKALEWIPRVPLTEIDLYIKKARDDGLTDFNITQNDPRGNMIVVERNKAFYYPVFYVEPLQGNEKALGYDLSSSPARKKTIIASMNSGETLATSPIQLVQDQQKAAAYLFMEPIYRGDRTLRQARLENFQGFALGVFRIQPLFLSSLNSTGLYNSEVLVHMEDISEAASPVSLFKTYNKEPDREAIRYRQTITTKRLGRTWRMTLHPSPQFIRQFQSNRAQIVFISGMAFTLLVISFLYLLIGREREVRLLVEHRTRQLQLEQRRSQAILDTTLNAIITINASGLIQSCNPAGQKLFGYQETELLNNNIKMLMPPPYAQQHDEYLNNYLTTNVGHIIGSGREVMGLKKDGSTFPMFLSVDKASLEDTVIFVGVIVDLSQQKENEKILVGAKEKAEMHSRAKSEFLSMMSHELRTPLTVILGYLPLLTDRNKLPLPGIITEIANEMKDSGEHLLVLINDILDISKIEAGKLEIKRQWQNSHNLVEECLQTLEKSAQHKNLKLINQVPDLRIFSDPTRLKQIFINLLSNAIKFTDQGAITVRGEQSEKNIIFEVEDTGCGIDNNVLPLLFDKFYQVDSSSTREVRGTGLGLAISKRLIELHGGSISVASQLGVGTTFTFSINNILEANHELNSTG